MEMTLAPERPKQSSKDAAEVAAFWRDYAVFVQSADAYRREHGEVGMPEHMIREVDTLRQAIARVDDAA